MVDVRMRQKYLERFELQLPQPSQKKFDVSTRVDDNCTFLFGLKKDSGILRKRRDRNGVDMEQLGPRRYAGIQSTETLSDCPRIAPVGNAILHFHPCSPGVIAANSMTQRIDNPPRLLLLGIRGSETSFGAWDML